MTIKKAKDKLAVKIQESAGVSVAVNSSNNFFSSDILMSVAGKIINDSAATQIKNIVKEVNIQKDSERISNGTGRVAAATTRTAPITQSTPPPSATQYIPETIRDTITQTLSSSNIPTQEQSSNDLFIGRGTGSFVPFFPTGTPPTGSGATDTREIGIAVSSSISPGELSIFGANSFFMIPVNPEMIEKTTGLELKKWEKPRVIAIIAENVLDGYPRSHAVIFKKLTSNRALVTKYIVYRKAVFKDREFEKVAEISPEEAVVPNKYVQIVSDLYNIKDVFVYVDNYIPINATYVYKIEVEWVAIGPEPDENFNPELYLGFSVEAGLLGRLFMSGSI